MPEGIYLKKKKKVKQKNLSNTETLFPKLSPRGPAERETDTSVKEKESNRAEATDPDASRARPVTQGCQ